MSPDAVLAARNLANDRLFGHVDAQRCVLDSIRHRLNPRTARIPILGSGAEDSCSWNLILRGLTDVFIHVTYIALPFVPFYVLTLGVWDGVRLFGPQALHRGVFSGHTIHLGLSMLRTASTVSVIGLILSLAPRYLLFEFNTTVVHGEVSCTRNACVKSFFAKWSGFQGVQLVWTFVSMTLLGMALLLGLLGVVLHLFTHVFLLTAVASVAFAAYQRTKRTTELWSLVTREVLQAEVLIDRIKEHLVSQLMGLHTLDSLRLSEFANGITRTEFEQQHGAVSDYDWEQMDADEDGRVTGVEYVAHKRSTMQKACVMMRSAVERSIQGKLSEMGLSTRALLVGAVTVGSGVALLLYTVYLLMHAANAVSEMHAAVTSMCSAAAMTLFQFTQGAKPLKLNPKVKQALESFNRALCDLVRDLLRELVQALHLFPESVNGIRHVIDQLSEEDSANTAVIAAALEAIEPYSESKTCPPAQSPKPPGSKPLQVSDASKAASSASKASKLAKAREQLKAAKDSRPSSSDSDEPAELGSLSDLAMHAHRRQKLTPPPKAVKTAAPTQKQRKVSLEEARANIHKRHGSPRRANVAGAMKSIAATRTPSVEPQDQDREPEASESPATLSDLRSHRKSRKAPMK